MNGTVKNLYVPFQFPFSQLKYRYIYLFSYKNDFKCDNW